uniref:Chromosome 19 open reading frame 12 n=1 Tax=Cyprinodon variegatus TaxID=28743 RepID=A0A3Q2FLA4_CYPVA
MEQAKGGFRGWGAKHWGAYCTPREPAPLTPIGTPVPPKAPPERGGQGPAAGPTSGAVGGLLGSWMASGQFRPLPQILRELPSQQRKQLYAVIEDVLGSLERISTAQLSKMVTENSKLERHVIAALISYVKRYLGAEVRYEH